MAIIRALRPQTTGGGKAPHLVPSLPVWSQDRSVWQQQREREVRSTADHAASTSVASTRSPITPSSWRAVWIAGRMRESELTHSAAMLRAEEGSW